MYIYDERGDAMDIAVEQVNLSGREDEELKQNNSNNTQLQRPKEPSELQQIHVRKLLIAIQTMLDDFASSQKKCSCCEKEEVLVAAKIEKAQQNIGRLPKSDNPEYIRLKKLKWEHKIQLACNCYIKTLNQFQIENEGFVAFLKLFQKELKRVLNSLVAVQPLPESMRNEIAGGNKLFNLDASVENEAARKVQKVILKPIPEIGIKEPKVQLSTVLEDEEKTVNKEKNDDGNKKGPEVTEKASKVIAVVPPTMKTDSQEKIETAETKPVVLNTWQKRLRGKYNEAALNPLLPKNAEIVIYTDGSLVSTNKNTVEKIDSGGYAAILLFRQMDDAEIVISGHKSRPSSSDYMELLAICKALKRLKKYNITGKVVLYSDALGVVNDFNVKLAGWKDCGWKRADGKYVRFWKIWKKVWKLSKKIDLRVCWVKGHAESKLNKRCDEIARAEARLRAI